MGSRLGPHLGLGLMHPCSFSRSPTTIPFGEAELTMLRPRSQSRPVGLALAEPWQRKTRGLGTQCLALGRGKAWVGSFEKCAYKGLVRSPRPGLRFPAEHLSPFPWANERLHLLSPVPIHSTAERWVSGRATRCARRRHVCTRLPISCRTCTRTGPRWTPALSLTRVSEARP